MGAGVGKVTVGATGAAGLTGLTGLLAMLTKSGCSVLSSVYPMAPAVYFTVIREP